MKQKVNKTNNEKELAIQDINNLMQTTKAEMDH